jgi:hypothetical protein
MAEAGLTCDGKAVGSAEAAQRFFRQMCDQYRPGDIVDPDSRDHVCLLWLIEGHPHRADLCPAGVDAFCVHLNSAIGYSGNATGFSVIATGSNGRAVPFSIPKALSGLESTPAEQAHSAFRHAIEYQVSFWRQQNFREGILRCPVFGDVLTTANTHIDHDPPFKILVEGFLLQSALAIADVPMHDADNGCVPVWLPKEPVLSAWRQFHWQHMRLQFVSIAGHHELGRVRRVAEAKEKEEEKRKHAAQDVFGRMRS